MNSQSTLRNALLRNPQPRVSQPSDSAETGSRMFDFELCFYAAVTILTMSYMLRTIMIFSSPSRPEFQSYSSLLSPSWINSSWLIDNSDAQYRSFRNNLPVLLPLMIAHASVSNYIQSAFPKPLTENFDRLLPRTLFSLIFSIVFVAVFNGISGMLKILLLLVANYYLAKSLGESRIAPVVAWVFGLTVLVGTHYLEGFQFEWVFSFLGFLDKVGYKGISPRWWDPLRFCFLRMISFSLDYHWACRDREFQTAMNFGAAVISSDRKGHSQSMCKTCAVYGPCEKLRIETKPDFTDFSLSLYLTYVLYTPLYLAGPIITFNDFVYQQHHRLPLSRSPRQLAMYFFRWVCALAIMEFLMHTTNVIALAKVHAWTFDTFTGMDIVCLAYFNLNHIWLKLLLVWRFFRAWALFDGVETVENMSRCMSNNYSASGFWRAWHVSFNRWIIRYAYGPLGGGGKGKKGVIYFANTLVIFTFVAIWHDLSKG
ncbi:glycerol transporter [Entophlyctis sp. JEL0112]|nr:glycerol transporter [Entophlyctis sp. JEL0112]